MFWIRILVGDYSISEEPTASIIEEILMMEIVYSSEILVLNDQTT
jgi:hypothetical protein